MNERIKELLTPKLKEWGGASSDNFSEELEKFAELIVRDCMLICEDVMKKDNSALGCWSQIKGTFRS
jgi:hypothetical protein